MQAQAYKDLAETEVIFIDGIQDAINYILRFLDVDSEFTYSEKEVIRLFFQFDAFKGISFKDFQNFLNQIQQQKNNINH